MREIDEALEEQEFLKLATKYAKHYHDTPDDSCLVCQAIYALDRGQLQVAMMMDGRRETMAEDMDDIRTLRNPLEEM